MLIEYIVLFLVVYGWTSIFVINKQEINPYCFVVSCSSIIITIFIFSVFQNLRIGLFVVSAIGFVGSIYSVKKIISNRNLIPVQLYQFFSLIVIFILAFLASWGADYWAWDEFSHWGTQVEYLLLNDNLQIDSKLLLFPDYIPGISLWRYFGRNILKTTGVSGSYFISFVLIYSCIYAVSYNRSIIKWLLTALVVLLGLLVFFQALVSSLMVDPIQSLLFMCALKIISDDNYPNFVYLILVTIAVVLMKHVGIILSFFIAGYYIILHLVVYKNRYSLVLKEVGVILLPAILFYIFWIDYRNYYGISTIQLNSSRFLNGNVADYLNEFWINIVGVLNSIFPHALFVEPFVSINGFSHGIALWIFTIFICMLGLILLSLPNENKKIGWINFLFVLTSCFLYLIFLAYIRATYPSMQGDIYSMSRYFSVVLFSGFFLLVLVSLNDSIVRIIGVGFVVTVLFLLMAPPLNTIISFKKRPDLLINNEYNEKARLVKKQAASGDVVWYINSENAMAYFVFRMKMIPWQVLGYEYGRGLYLDNDLQNRGGIDNRIDSFSKRFCEANIVFIDDVNPEFWDQYSGLFDKRNGKIYKIRQVDGKKCHAVFLE